VYPQFREEAELGPRSALSGRRIAREFPNWRYTHDLEAACHRDTRRSAAFACLARAQDYKVLKIQLVGGDGGFDYVTADPDGRNLYVARSGPAGHIGVFNLDTLAQVETSLA